MCYAKPGPRCSGHMKEALVRARKNLEEHPDSEKARGALKEAEREFYATPAGIAYLSRKAEKATDPTKAEQFSRDAEYYKKVRAAQLEAYNRVKHLPQERREWDYDTETGYADGWNVEEDTWNQPLINVHTGAGEDYLAANQLTELYGWTTDDASGEEEEPVYIDSPYGLMTPREVRSVKLENVVTGETRTVYRLNDGDGMYSTFGSYEDAARSLDELGTVVTKDEYESLSEGEDSWDSYDDSFASYSSSDEPEADTDGYFVGGGQGTDDYDSEGFNREGRIAYQFRTINGRTSFPNVNRTGHNERGFKVAQYNAAAEGTDPTQRFEVLDDSREASVDWQVLENADVKDASLPFHHEETGTLFGHDGLDYWGRNRAEVAADRAEYVDA